MLNFEGVTHSTFWGMTDSTDHKMDGPFASKASVQSMEVSTAIYHTFFGCSYIDIEDHASHNTPPPSTTTTNNNNNTNTNNHLCFNVYIENNRCQRYPPDEATWGGLLKTEAFQAGSMFVRCFDPVLTKHASAVVSAVG